MDDFLGRSASPLDEAFWSALDATVVETARGMLTARRFLPLCGPLGAGVQVAPVDRPIPTERTEDFWILWRDVEAAKREGLPVDLHAAHMAAQALCRREDQMVFYGVKRLGIEGLLTTGGTNVLDRGDWSAGESSFTDIAAGMAVLQQKGRIGRITLVLSQDLFVQLHRIQPGTGLTEIERVRSLLEGRLLQPGTALLLCPQPQYMDLVVGQDIRTAYAEQLDLNHRFRILETACPRIKSPDAIVVYRSAH